MANPFRSLDRILRGEATELPLLRSGSFDVPIVGLIGVIILLGAVYGACMGLPSLLTRWHGSFKLPTGELIAATRAEGVEQVLASMVKVPLLFLLTLLVTFPSLYVFNALIGSRLRIGALLKLLVAAISVMVALLAAFGPIVAFFAASTDSYPFMKLLNVAVFSVAGFMGLAFLLKTLQRLTVAQQEPSPSVETEPPPPGVAGPYAAGGRFAGQVDPAVKTVFRTWVFVFGLVGAQMGWVLRPFIGDPTKPFSFFRPRESNFFEGLGNTLSHLLGHW